MKYIILIIALIIISCTKVIEPVTFGEYFLLNLGTNTIYVETSSVTLLESEILPSEKVHIFTAIEGTGGHVRPSNFLSDFSVYHLNNSIKEVIYTGVKDDDWIFEGVDNEGHQIFTISIL